MTDPEKLGLRPVKKKAEKNPLGLRPVGASPEDIGLRPVTGQADSISPDISFFDALGKTIEPVSDNAILQGLEYVGNTISIPTRLLYAGIQSGITDETFNQALAKKTEAGRVLFGEDAGLLGLGADILLDPMNFISGAGLVKGAKKVGRFFGAAEDVADVAKVAGKAGKAEKIAEDVADLDKALVGEGKLTKDPYISQILKNDQEKVARFRGPKVDIKEKSQLIREMDDTTVSKLYDDVVSGNYKGADATDKAFILAEKIKRNVKDIALAGKEGKVDDALANYIAASTGSARVLRSVRDLNYEIINAFKNLDDPDALDLLVKAGMSKKDITPTTMQKFVEWATMIKLTGLSTHVRAALGNGSMLFFRPFEKAGAAAVDALVSGVKGTKRSVYAREALAEINGARHGIKEALRKATETLKSEEKALLEQSKFGETIARGGAIRGRDFGEFGKRVGVRNFGEFVRLPGRVIGAVDVFFKELNYGAELAAQATRAGLKNGLKGDKLERFVADAITDPVGVLGRDILEKVKFSATERVFQENLGEFAQHLGGIRNKAPITRLIMPFWNTPINLLKQATQRTILTAALPSTWKKIGKGGAEASEIIGRAVTGSLFMGSAIYAGLSGYITGSGGKKKDLLYTTGWQPYSIKFGDTYVGYRGFEPISSWLRAAGDIAEGVKGKATIDKIAKQFGVSYVSQFIENPFLMGIHDITSAQKDFERGDIPKIVPNIIVGATIPTIIQQWGTRVFDPVVRKPKGAMQTIASRTPGLSTTISPLKNVFGEEVVRYNPALQALGFQVSKKKDNRLAEELLRLNISIGRPSKRILGQELSDEEYDRLVTLTGIGIKQGLLKFMDAPMYKQLDDDQRQRVMRNAIDKIRSLIKHQDFQKYYRR